MEYTFTLKYRLLPADQNVDDLIERLGAEGCDDALVGVGQPGRMALEFTREANSARDALQSALADVKRAMPAAQLFEAAPDFVGLSDVALVVGVSRQNLRKLMLSHAASFPAPVHDGSTAVWHLADMLDWLHATLAYPLEPVTLDIARTTKQVNLVKQAEQISPASEKQLRLLVA